MLASNFWAKLVVAILLCGGISACGVIDVSAPVEEEEEKRDGIDLDQWFGDTLAYLTGNSQEEEEFVPRSQRLAEQQAAANQQAVAGPAAAVVATPLSQQELAQQQILMAQQRQAQQQIMQQQLAANPQMTLQQQQALAAQQQAFQQQSAALAQQQQAQIQAQQQAQMAAQAQAVATAPTPRAPAGQYAQNFARFGLGPNVHLWRASLEVLSFMPMALADPVAGVIQTNWHTAQSAQGERLRVEVYVLNDQLRADALRVNTYRQTINLATGQWQDAPVNPTTAQSLENQILERALQRQLSGQ